MNESDLRAQLSAIEPTEETYANIGAQDVTVLRHLLDTEEEPWLAARAVFALSRIGDDRAVSAIRRAAEDNRPEVRVAVAAIAPTLEPDISNALLPPLLGDEDLGVRKFAISAVSDRNNRALRERIATMATDEEHEALRAAASDKLVELDPPS
jgi:HEAT repeat protein